MRAYVHVHTHSARSCEITCDENCACVSHDGMSLPPLYHYIASRFQQAMREHCRIMVEYKSSATDLRNFMIRFAGMGSMPPSPHVEIY